MSFGFPSYYSEKYYFKNKPDLKTITKGLEYFSWEIETISNNEIIAKSDINFWTWGEIIRIRFRKTFIIITSTCSFPLQCFDWGKNKENVLELIKKIRTIECNQTENSLDDFIISIKKNYLLLENEIISETEFMAKKQKLISHLPYDLISRNPFDFLNLLSPLKNQGALSLNDLEIIKSNVL